MQSAVQLIDRLTDLCAAGARWLIPVMALLTVIVAVLRYALSAPTIALQESVVYMHAAVFMLGIAVTLKAGAHVRVDILYGRMGPRAKAAVDLAGTVVFLLPVAGFIFYTSLSYVSFSWSLWERSPEPGGLPFVYALKTLIPALATLVTLQGLAEALRSLLVLTGRNVRAPE